MSMVLGKKTRDNISGLLFISPFILGFLLFFLRPMYQSLIFSLSRLDLIPGGYELTRVGWENYLHIFTVDPHYLPRLQGSIMSMLSNVPIILAFSIFCALLINQKFRGRLLVRVILFLPVIMASGIVLRIEMDDFFHRMTQAINPGQIALYSRDGLSQFMLNMNLPVWLIEFSVTSAFRAGFIIRNSGVQILIMLAGLQCISPSLYEAADVEGCTAWEKFWLVTLPVVSPFILTTIVFTVIDQLASPMNTFLDMIRYATIMGGGYGVSSAMGMVYFASVFIILLGVVFIVSRFVFYER